MKLLQHRNTTCARGFSLVELLVVIAVIGIIAAVAIPSMMASRAAAREKQAQILLSEIAAQESTYRMLRRRYGSLAEMKTTGTGGGMLLTDEQLQIPGWTISEVPNALTANTFGIQAAPQSDSAGDGTYVIFQDRVLRRCAKTQAVTVDCPASAN